MATNTADVDLPNKKEPSKFTNTNNKLRVVYIYRERERDVHYLHYASLTARSLSTLVTPQFNPTMCNRTSCAQVHELP